MRISQKMNWRKPNMYQNVRFLHKMTIVSVKLARYLNYSKYSNYSNYSNIWLKSIRYSTSNYSYSNWKPYLQLPFLLLLLLFFFAFQNFNNGNAYSIVWGCYQGRTFLGETNLPLNCHPFFVRRLCLLLCSLLHLRCQQTPCKKYRCSASFATFHCVSRYSKKVPKRYRISNFHMRSW